MVQSVLLLLGVAVLLVGLVGLFAYLAEGAAFPHLGGGILAVRKLAARGVMNLLIPTRMAKTETRRETREVAVPGQRGCA